MTPRTFVKLAIAAVASSVAALAVYAANAPWSDAKVVGRQARAAPRLSMRPRSARIAIAQGPAR